MSEPTREGGEEALIATYFAPLAGSFGGAHGLRDDCASLATRPGFDFVLTVDAIAAGVHFFANDPPFEVGWKALAVNVSDLVAKGATPLCYLMSVAFPEHPGGSWLEGFAAGLRAAQEEFGIVLAGGDTDRRSASPVSITITAIGEVPCGQMVGRDTARPGDRLFVSGTLGCAALGLRLRRDPALALALGLRTEAASALVQRYLRPEPPHRLAPVLLRHASAAIDLSDGLAKDLARLARASGVGVEVDTSLLPLSAAFRAAMAARGDLIEDALSGGDDYQVLAAVPPECCEAFVAQSRAADVSVTAIGRVCGGVDVRVHDADGQPVELLRPGWDHFA